MIQPKPFKFLCKQCGYSKVIKPKSDALSPMDMINICPKCKSTMKRKELNIVDKLFG
jgi:Zn finger protein HypA/HybF involved in hydrogenase expression